MLADKYGRVLVQHVEDGDYYQCVAWVDGDTRFDFDSASDQELVTVMIDRGFVEGLTIDDGLNVTVNIGGLTESYVWNDVSKEFDYDFDSWVNGSRTLTTKWFAKSDGTHELVVVDTASETPVYFVDGAGTSRCLVINNPGEASQYFGIDMISEHSELTSWHSVDCYESTAPGEGMATLNIVNFGPNENIFVITINEDGEYRDGSAQLPVVPKPNLKWRATENSEMPYILVDNEGKVVTDNNGFGLANNDNLNWIFPTGSKVDLFNQFKQLWGVSSAKLSGGPDCEVIFEGFKWTFKYENLDLGTPPIEVYE